MTESSRYLKAGILAIGTELLMGQTVNTNATFLSQKLNEIGIGVYYHMTVGDNPMRIENILKLLIDECDIIFTTGGLGPTQDDITKDIIAKALGLEMVFDPHSMERIEKRFRAFNRVMTENNKRQAYFPENAQILDNDMGTAPACIMKLEALNKHIVVLPGPPKEMKWLYDEYIQNYLLALNPNKMFSKYLSVYDLGESSTEDALLDLINDQTDPTIATYAGDGKVLVRVTSFGHSNEKCQQSVNSMVSEIKKRIGSYIISEEGKDINEVVASMLLEKNLSIAFVESCTGGKLVESIVKFSGVSKVVDRGIVTYSNKAKTDEVGVSEQTLLTHGAVSHETCFEMVKGLCEKTGSTIGVSITGVAGPTGGTVEKPVGLVYIGLKIGHKIMTFENHFSGDRLTVQNRAVNKALKMLYDELSKL
ncbi:competence/damage-inducible protein A [Fusibacter sp. 3D3]|uniref:competence/damage-inducible protein A n=1 Tax=Fusibacter sp. 3D3 TaxID=1048380 RepID=UPI000852D33A|nr:competence/damage-inducible protein A [Fusibacter sp. 3D3]GAU79096.1 molybdopterin binding motif, CinA N-terminal domain [Fusibacter sp. 3D3]